MNRLPIPIIGFVAFLSGTTLPFTSLQAQGILDEARYVVGASLGYSTFAFPEKLDHDVSFPSASLTLAATTRQWQLSVSLGTSLEEADISEEEDVGEASRTDMDLTIGLPLTPEWTFFGGYKSGETNLDYVSRESLDIGVPEIQRESYSQEGVYVGLGYSWRFQNAGAINLSIAYADMTASNEFFANTDEDEGPDEVVEFDDLNGLVEGDLNGFSYALTWTMPVSSTLLFQTRFRVNDYKQNIEFLGQTFNNVDVNFNSLHVGLARVF